MQFLIHSLSTTATAAGRASALRLPALLVAWLACAIAAPSAWAAPTADERFDDVPPAAARPAPLQLPPLRALPASPGSSDGSGLPANAVAPPPLAAPAAMGASPAQPLDTVIELQGRGAGLDFSASSRAPVAGAADDPRGAPPGTAAGGGLAGSASTQAGQQRPAGSTLVSVPYRVVQWLRENRLPVLAVAVAVIGAMLWVTLRKRRRNR